MAVFNRVIAVAGPTACGKTAVAVELAKLVGGEVVCADSMQVYARLSVGTARPREDETGGVRHHLFGYVDPSQAYSLARYCADADAALREILGRGRVPVLCGGTGLYLSALKDGIELADETADPCLRERLWGRLEREGAQSLLDELRERDPKAAALVHPNNRKRLVRYLELVLQTGLTMDERNAKSRENGSGFDFFTAVLMPGDREKLRRRISERADAMAASGLVGEARLVYDNRQSWPTVAQAIGYKELFGYFEGTSSLDGCLERLKTATAQYAKRQITWFKRMSGARVYAAPDSGGDAARTAKKIYDDFA